MSSEGLFIPLSMRRAGASARAAFEEPRDGVPDYLKPSFRNWLEAAFHELAGYGDGEFDWEKVEHLVLSLERITKRLFQRSDFDVDETVRGILNAVEADAELCLDVVEILVSRLGRGHELVSLMETILTEGGSLFTVSTLGSPLLLGERVNQTMREVADGVMSEDTRQAAHLRNAWIAGFGRVNQERASEAYREAVRAVESALRSIVSPRNGRATLGTMIRDIKQAPQNFSVRLDGLAGDSAVNAFAEHLNQLWKSQLDRHGTDDETTPISVSPEQAKDAVVLAVSIVHVVQTGGFSRVEP